MWAGSGRGVAVGQIASLPCPQQIGDLIDRLETCPTPAYPKTDFSATISRHRKIPESPAAAGAVAIVVRDGRMLVIRRAGRYFAARLLLSGRRHRERRNRRSGRRPRIL